MAEPRDFDAEFPPEQQEPLQFVLGGQTLTTQTYLHPSVFLKSGEGVEGVVEFLSKVLEPTSRDIFNKMVNDPDIHITIQQIGEASSWVIGEMSGRPTNEPDSSGSGAEATS